MTQEEKHLIEQRTFVEKKIEAAYNDLRPVLELYKNTKDALRSLRMEYQDDECQKMINEALFEITSIFKY